MNKENLKEGLDVGVKVGKTIIGEGTRIVLLGAVAVGIGKLLGGGIPRLKNGTLDDYLRIRKTEEEAIDVDWDELEESEEE